VYDPSERREIRRRYAPEHARDFLPSVFGGDTLPALRESREIYRQAQLRGNLPLAPVLSHDPQLRTGQIKLLGDLQDLISQYSRQVVQPQWEQAVAKLPPDRATLATATNPRLGGRAGAHPDPVRYVGVGERLRLEQQVTGQLVAQFNPDDFRTWLAGPKQQLHPYQEEALENLLGWKQIQWLRGAELGRTMGVAAFTNTFAEALAGPLSEHLLAPLLSRFGAGGRWLLRKAGQKSTADAIERFGTTDAGKTFLKLHHGGVKVGSFGAVQQPTQRVLSGQTTDAIRGAKDKPRAVAQEGLELTKLAGLGFGMGYATGVPLWGLGTGFGRVSQVVSEHPTVGRLLKRAKAPTAAEAEIVATEAAPGTGSTQGPAARSPYYAGQLTENPFVKLGSVPGGASDQLQPAEMYQLHERYLHDLGYDPKTGRLRTLEEMGVPHRVVKAFGIGSWMEKGATHPDPHLVLEFPDAETARLWASRLSEATEQAGAGLELPKFDAPNAAGFTFQKPDGSAFTREEFEAIRRHMAPHGFSPELAGANDDHLTVYLYGSPSRADAAKAAIKFIDGLRRAGYETGQDGIKFFHGYTEFIERGEHHRTDAAAGLFGGHRSTGSSDLPDWRQSPVGAVHRARYGEFYPAERSRIIPPPAARNAKQAERRPANSAAQEREIGFPPGLRVAYRTREGTLKPGKIEGRNVDGTYRLSNGIAAAPAERLRRLDVPADADPTTTARPRPTAAPPPLAVGTEVKYQRSSGAARRSTIVGVNPDGTYRLRNGIARADPKRLRVLGGGAPQVPLR
jgi:hypothetical protein